MANSTERSSRLSAAQIVIVVVAICLAAVLTPVGVYAANITKVRLIDGSSSRAVKVGTDHRLLTDVQGDVTATIPGTVNANVQGTVTAVGAAPPSSFSAFFSGNQSVASLFGSSSRVMVTSLTYANNGGTASFSWIYDYTDATCTTLNGYFTYAVTPALNTITVSFPTPLVLTKSCALFNLGVNTSVTITAYRG